MPRYHRFDSVNLPNGASVVCLDLCAKSDPPVWNVEVFNAPGSMGDGMTVMRESQDDLVALDSEELAKILRQPPNLYRDEPTTA